MALKSLGIGWEVGVESGWGTYGLNLALQAQLQGVRPDLFLVSPRFVCDPLRTRVLTPALGRMVINQRLMAMQDDYYHSAPVLHALGDRLSFPAFTAHLHGAPDIGVVFFESALIPPENVQAASQLPLIVAGSTWNKEVMERHGMTNVGLCLQGIDRSLFHPFPVERLFPDRFVIFSGGKLEYRKGQDLVLAAFRIFQQRHPDALLVTAWANLWPESVKTLQNSPHLKGIPNVRPDRSLAIDDWLMFHDIPADAFVDLGAMPNQQVPHVLRQADVALFPNRCEGGTNLVAMEAMACGVPVILSRNTGHLDLIAEVDGTPTCWPLDWQLPLAELTGCHDLADWGESGLDEIVATLEKAYADHDERRRRGAAAARFMERWDWSVRVRELLALVEAV